MLPEAPAAPRPAPAAPPTHGLSLVAPPAARTAPPALHDAIGAVFHAQAPAQQQAIVQGALKAPDNPVSRSVLAHASVVTPRGAMPAMHGGGGINLGGALSDVGHVAEGVGQGLIAGPTSLLRAGVDLYNKIPAQFNPVKLGEQGLVHGGDYLTTLLGRYQQMAQAGQRDLYAAAGATHNRNSPFAVSAAQPTAVSPQFAKNALSDVVTLPSEVGPSVALPVDALIHGHLHQALQESVGSYLSLASPKFWMQHPVDAALMVSSVLDPALRAGARVEHPESVTLSGNATLERPPFSRNRAIRAGQQAWGGHQFVRTKDGTLIPQPGKEWGPLKVAASRIWGENNRLRVVNKDEQLHAHMADTHPGIKPWTGNPESKRVVGYDANSLIARGIVGRASNYLRDLQAYRDYIAPEENHLTGEDLAAHLETRRFLDKEIAAALRGKRSPAALQPAFDAVRNYARDFKGKLEPERRARGLVSMSDRSVARREMLGAYLVHHPEVKFDPELGVPVSDSTLKAWWDQHTGGRQSVYVPDRARAGDRAFYLSTEHMPTPERHINTYTNLRNGVIDPTGEAMAESRVQAQGGIDSHEGYNRYANQFFVGEGQVGKTGTEALKFRDAHPEFKDYVPVRVGGRTRLTDAELERVRKGEDQVALEAEAAARALSLDPHNVFPTMENPDQPGRYALVHKAVVEALQEHEKQISPSWFMRSFRGSTSWWREVALAGSTRHVPGVMQELAIRLASVGAGPASWVLAHMYYGHADRIDPVLARKMRTFQTGARGSLLGFTGENRVYQPLQRFEHSPVYPFVKGYRAFLQAPGVNNLHSLWRSWVHLSLDVTGRMMEENSNKAVVGREISGRFGTGRPIRDLLHAWRDAMYKQELMTRSGNYFMSENGNRALRASVERVIGKWSDLTPRMKTALAFTPFGMWWVNSVKWLMRLPVDHPKLSGVLASMEAGTTNERNKLGLSYFSKNPLPWYEQGLIPMGGGKGWDAAYYSAWGTLSADPLSTAAGLVAPAIQPLMLAMLGDNGFGGELKKYLGQTPPGHQFGVRLTAILNSMFTSFVPFATKLEQMLGGKTPGQALSPIRTVKVKQWAAPPVLPNGGGLGGTSLGGTSLGGTTLGGSSLGP